MPTLSSWTSFLWWICGWHNSSSNALVSIRGSFLWATRTSCPAGRRQRVLRADPQRNGACHGAGLDLPSVKDGLIAYNAKFINEGSTKLKIMAMTLCLWTARRKSRRRGASKIFTARKPPSVASRTCRSFRRSEKRRGSLRTSSQLEPFGTGQPVSLGRGRSENRQPHIPCS